MRDVEYAFASCFYLRNSKYLFSKVRDYFYPLYFIEHCILCFCLQIDIFSSPCCFLETVISVFNSLATGMYFNPIPIPYCIAQSSKISLFIFIRELD